VTKTKPTRRDLIAVVERLQDHIGEAMQWVDADTTQNAKSRMRAALSAAHDLCITTREHDPPKRSSLAELQLDAEITLRRKSGSWALTNARKKK
jgi:hypothetical protein